MEGQQIFRLGEMNDAGEVLAVLWSCMHDAHEQAYKRHERSSKPWKSLALVDEMFGLEVHEVMACSRCKKVPALPGPLLCLLIPLPIPPLATPPLPILPWVVLLQISCLSLGKSDCCCLSLYMPGPPPSHIRPSTLKPPNFLLLFSLLSSLGCLHYPS